MIILRILTEYRAAIASGLLVTLEMCLFVWVIGIVAGVILGVVAASYKKEAGGPLRAISFLLGAVPVLVLLFWLHYPLQELLHVVINPFYTAVFALTIINTFGVMDIVRNALADFPKQYVLAARVCGLSARDTVREIQLPIISRQILPSVLTLQVNMLQLTLFASLISVEEIFRVAQRINSFVYRPVEVYSTLAIFFILICLPLNMLASHLKKKYTRDYSES